MEIREKYIVNEEILGDTFSTHFFKYPFFVFAIGENLADYIKFYVFPIINNCKDNNCKDFNKSVYVCDEEYRKRHPNWPEALREDNRNAYPIVCQKYYDKEVSNFNKYNFIGLHSCRCLLIERSVRLTRQQNRRINFFNTFVASSSIKQRINL